MESALLISKFQIYKSWLMCQQVETKDILLEFLCPFFTLNLVNLKCVITFAKEWLFSLSEKAIAMHFGLDRAEHLGPLLECKKSSRIMKDKASPCGFLVAS